MVHLVLLTESFATFDGCVHHQKSSNNDPSSLFSPRRNFKVWVKIMTSKKVLLRSPYAPYIDPDTFVLASGGYLYTVAGHRNYFEIEVEHEEVS